MWPQINDIMASPYHNIVTSLLSAQNPNPRKEIILGTYSVWIAADLESHSNFADQAREPAINLIEPYDDANEIPGDWPDLSFDYCHDEIPVHTSGFLLENIPDEKLLATLVTPKYGQTGLPDDDPERRQELILLTLLVTPGQLVSAMH